MGCSESKDVNPAPGGVATDLQNTSQLRTTRDKQSSPDPTSTTEQTLASPDGDYTNFAQVALQEHNAYRETHHAPGLVLNPQLCQMAERLCRHLAEARTFANSNPESRMHNGEECGESLYRHWGGKKEVLTAEATCKSWYDEVDNYHQDMPGFDLASCHFTQMVWKKTQEFGIAHAYYDDDDGFRKSIVVANYFPAGNIEGEYENNVVIPETFFDTKTLDDASSNAI